MRARVYSEKKCEYDHPITQAEWDWFRSPETNVLTPDKMQYTHTECGELFARAEAALTELEAIIASDWVFYRNDDTTSDRHALLETFAFLASVACEPGWCILFSRE